MYIIGISISINRQVWQSETVAHARQSFNFQRLKHEDILPFPPCRILYSVVKMDFHLKLSRWNFILGTTRAHTFPPPLPPPPHRDLTLTNLSVLIEATYIKVRIWERKQSCLEKWNFSTCLGVSRTGGLTSIWKVRTHLKMKDEDSPQSEGWGRHGRDSPPSEERWGLTLIWKVTLIWEVRMTHLNLKGEDDVWFWKLGNVWVVRLVPPGEGTLGPTGDKKHNLKGPGVKWQRQKKV